MARPKTPDGKSTLLAFKISQRQKAAYDAARGDLEMADWARSVLDSAASGGTPRIDSDAPPGTRRPGKPEVPQAAFSDPPVNPLPPPAPETRRCNHPGRRVNGGWCPECQWTILPGGRFAERVR